MQAADITPGNRSGVIERPYLARLGQAQVGNVAPTKGGAIHQKPEGRQVKALRYPLGHTHRLHVVANGVRPVGAGLPAEYHQATGEAGRQDAHVRRSGVIPGDLNPGVAGVERTARAAG